MSSPDLHPENLLDKLASGSLSSAESALLHQHLAECSVCRFELMVRDDLETEAEALQFDRISPLQLLRALPVLSERATAAGAPSPPTPVAAPSPAPAPEALAPLPVAPLPVVTPPTMRRVRKRRVVSITLAALAFASGAAALVSGELPFVGHDQREPGRSAPSESGTQAKRLSAAPAKVSTPPVAAAPTEAPSPEPPSSKAADPRGTAALATPTDRAAREQPTRTAAELFADANQARRASDAARATSLYRQLQREFPRSAEAQLSLVTLGSLQLDGGNAAGALATFNRYLSQRGRPLEAEALYGQARALRRLGRAQEEELSWKRLLARYPGSGYANHAQERLASLSAP